MAAMFLTILISLIPVAVLGGFLYVAGGEETNDQRSPLNTAHRYDPRTDTWLQITSMRQARESFQVHIVTSRYGDAPKLGVMGPLCRESTGHR